MGIFERFATKVTLLAGSTGAFLLAVALVVVWLITGPIFDYSETWQLVINTGTTIITFLMVFLIQKSQNKESLAIQLKLNELVASHEHASNRLVNVEGLTEEELRIIQKYYFRLSDLAMKERNIQQTHSIDEAQTNNDYKNRNEHKPVHKRPIGKSKEPPRKN